MTESPSRIFVLSPASCRGKRASMLLSPRARFALAEAVRHGEAPLGEVFSFLSGLYFRGKLAYAQAFARPPAGVPGVLVVTPTEGLRVPDRLMSADLVSEYARGDIALANATYAGALRRDAEAIRAASSGVEVVLLGSIATDKYAAILSGVFGEKLRFPAAFVGRGDMSRGGLLLRHARSGVELDYRALEGAPRKGKRPPRLDAPTR